MKEDKALKQLKLDCEKYENQLAILNSQLESLNNMDQQVEEEYRGLEERNSDISSKLT